jgi:CheY-like chemotaxis protein
MRVLVVEDDRDAREGLVELLRNHSFAVRAAHDGRTALDALAAGAPDVILLDLALPDMGGDEFLGAIREDARHERIQVVVMSAWARNIDPPVPIAGWLPKPVDTAALLALLERLAKPS